MIAVTPNDSSLTLSHTDKMEEGTAGSSDLSTGMRGFIGYIDNTQSYDDIQKLPKSWHEDDDTSIDKMWERFNSQPKAGTTDGEIGDGEVTSTQEEVEVGERATPPRGTRRQRGVISKWLKKPARKIWKTIREIFKRER